MLGRRSVALCSVGWICLFAINGMANEAPPQAAFVGYTVNTFSSSFSGKTVDTRATRAPGFSWYLWDFFGSQTARSAVQINSDGSVTLKEGIGGSTNNIVTVAPTKNPANSAKFVGVAFGGGAYIEAVLKFDPDKVLKGGPKSGWPSFWSLAVEHMVGKDQWPGQPKGYAHFIEVDIFEYAIAFGGRPRNFYAGTLHDWYGVYKKTCSGGGFCNIRKGYADIRMPVPRETDFKEYHAYGFLWVPATPARQGYAQYYFDGMPVGKQTNWTLLPNQPPPPRGFWVFSILDRQHLALVLGTSRTAPMTVKSVNVWQSSDEHNLRN